MAEGSRVNWTEVDLWKSNTESSRVKQIYGREK